MKNGIKNIVLGILLLITYCIIGTLHSGKLTGPMYILHFVVKTSMQDGNIFAIIFWYFLFIIAMASMLLGVKSLTIEAYKHFMKKHN